MLKPCGFVDLPVFTALADNEAIASIGCYRFNRYAQLLQNNAKEEIAFGRIMSFYKWEGNLRFFLFEILSFIEISFRSAVVYEMLTITEDPFWYMEKSLFKDKLYENNLREIEKSIKTAGDKDVLDFRRQFGKDAALPCWILAELVSFGKWSRLFGSLKKRMQVRKIANRLGILPENLVSWVRSLATLRNLCAHHSCLWNRHIPNSPNGKIIEEQGWNRDLLGSRLFVISVFLNKHFDKKEDFLFDLNKIIKECPESNCRAMLGIPLDF
jgi:abortive infection bacteriophage resistance protein